MTALALPSDVSPLDAVVIGAGPAGAVVARLLAAWGHSVCVLHRTAAAQRGLAESIPPSTQKLLSEAGVLDAVEAAAFYRSRGNTVWWGSAGDAPARVETFGPSALGYQVFRPALDRVLLDCAVAAGARAVEGTVTRVHLDAPCHRVEWAGAALTGSARCRVLIDASGRAGVVARRFRQPQPGYRTAAIVGVWTRHDEWPLPDVSHTTVESYAGGWAWSVPVSAAARHVAVMFGQAPAPSSTGGRSAVADAYACELARTTHTRAVVGGATLDRVWACDASLYSSSAYGAERLLLAGDAGSFIDPLSSFGVKKALASAWLAAVAAHTSLVDASREAIAREYFEAREREMYATHLARSGEFARAAARAHRDPFWTARADAALDPSTAAAGPVADPADVRRAFERFRAASQIDLEMSPTARFVMRPVIRGREIVLEEALDGGVRFVGNVDLVKLAGIAPRHRQVPDLFEAYCHDCAPAPLPAVVSGLSVLVARGILHDRT